MRQSVPPVRSIFNPTNTAVAQLSNNDAWWVLLHSSRWRAIKNSAVALTRYLYTRGVHGRIKANNADLKLPENCVMNGFIMFGVMFMTASGLENSPQSFDVYTVSQSRSVVTSAENPTTENSPQSIGELRDGHVANLQELLYQIGSKNGVIYNYDTCVNCVNP